MGFEIIFNTTIHKYEGKSAKKQLKFSLQIGKKIPADLRRGSGLSLAGRGGEREIKAGRDEIIVKNSWMIELRTGHLRLGRAIHSTTGQACSS